MDLQLKHYRKTWEDKKAIPKGKKKESPERELNEIESSSLSEKEFRVMVIRMFKQLDDK